MLVTDCATVIKSLSVWLAGVKKSSVPVPPGTIVAMSAVYMTTPESRPILELTPLKNPICVGSPEKVMFEAETPFPKRISSTRYCSLSKGAVFDTLI